MINFLNDHWEDHLKTDVQRCEACGKDMDEGDTAYDFDGSILCEMCGEDAARKAVTDLMRQTILMMINKPDFDPCTIRDALNSISKDKGMSRGTATRVMRQTILTMISKPDFDPWAVRDALDDIGGDIELAVSDEMRDHEIVLDEYGEAVANA